MSSSVDFMFLSVIEWPDFWKNMFETDDADINGDLNFESPCYFQLLEVVNWPNFKWLKIYIE